MAGLGGRMHNGGGTQIPDQRQDPGAVANVDFMMGGMAQVALQPPLVPTGVPLRPEEYGALVVVHTMDAISQFGRKIGADLRTNQFGRTGH